MKHRFRACLLTMMVPASSSSFFDFAATKTDMQDIIRHAADKIAADLQRQQQQNIRSHVGRHLQEDLIPICDRVYNIFPAASGWDCSCSRVIQGQYVEYSCATNKAYCENGFQAHADNPITGNLLCVRPEYSGRFQFKRIKGNADFTIDLCIRGSMFGASIPVEDFCVSATICVTPDAYGLCDCSATYGSLSCSCSNCNGYDGVALDCSNRDIFVPPFCFGLPDIVTEKEVVPFLASEQQVAEGIRHVVQTVTAASMVKGEMKGVRHG